MKTYFINDWEGYTSDQVKKAFDDYNRTDVSDRNKDVEVVFASYDESNWEGTAFVLAIKDGLLYEAHAYHCSCYGLEDQFDLELTTPEYLKSFIEKGYHSYSNRLYISKLAEFLKVNYNIDAVVKGETK